MRSLLVTFVLVGLVTSPALAKPPTTPARLDFVPGELLLVTEEEESAPRSSSGQLLEPRDPRVASILAQHGLDRGSLVAHARKAGAGRARILRLSSSRPDFDPLLAAAELRATGAFRAVCPNYRIPLLVTLPNDPDRGRQWYVDSPSTADIRLPEAWDVARGDTSTVIAIIDTGVDTGHPDLPSKIWINRGEIPGNGIDDDANGFIDDRNGWDFGVGDNDPNPESTPDAETGIDVGFHGTFCAGIAAAATNNGVGIAGASWNCRVMPLKVSDANGNLTSDAIAAAVAYAVDMGASVISMSFGAPGDPGVPDFFQSLVDMATGAGVTCLAAAGNDNNTTPIYPAGCEAVIAVAATDEGAARADFSNWGTWVDVAAPGASMWSTICRNYDIDEFSQAFYLYYFYWDGVTPYMYGDGTSFACPLAAGVCGLILAHRPYLTPQQVNQHLIATGDNLPFDHPIGPKVNAYRAVSTGVLDVAGPPGRRLRFCGNTPNPFTRTTTLRFALPAEGRVKVALFDCAGRQVRDLVDATLSAGPQAVTWDGATAEGRRVPGGIYFARLESGGETVQAKTVLVDR